ncbi:MAG: ribonuclease P protein component [Burkholderiales bacterium]
MQEIYSTVIIKHTFTSEERLKSKKLIDQLFTQGKAFNLYPIRVMYYTDQDLAINHHQVLFAVPKKKCKSAVVRNKLKRRMREAYRLNKHLLQVSGHPKPRFLMGYIYTGDPFLGSFQTIQKKIIQALELLRALPDYST